MGYCTFTNALHTTTYMSYLTSYRLNYWGTFYTNPGTANNDDRSEYIVDPVAGTLGSALADAHCDTDLATKKLETMDLNPPEPPPFDVNNLYGSWNYQGAFDTYFKDAYITSYGQPGDIKQDDALANQGVYLLGSRYPGSPSLDPVGSPVIIAQDVTGDRVFKIIAGGMQIGGGPNGPLLKVMQNTETYSYSEVIRTNRSEDQSNDPPQSLIGGFTSHGVVWQIGFEYSEATKANWIVDETNPQIAELMTEVRANKGLVMRFSTFECLPDFLATDLEKEMKPNPAYGYLIGTVGVWHEDDLATSLPGRRLVTYTPDPDPSDALNNTHGDTYVQLNPKTNVLSVDLVNTFPKERFREKPTDLTELSRNIIQTGTPEIAYEGAGVRDGLALLPYNPITYYLTGGIVDVQLTPEQAAGFYDQPLQLRIMTARDMLPPLAKPWLYEQPYRIQSAQRGLYIDANATAPVELRIRKYGKPLTEPVELTVKQRTSGFLGMTGFDPELYAPPSVTVFDASNNALATESQAGGTLTVQPAESEAYSLQLKWLKATCSLVSVWAPGSDMESFYMVNKTYAVDDYSAVIAQRPNIPWETVYKEVLCYYAAIFPAMNSYGVFFQNKDNMISLAKAIETRMSPTYEPTTLFMPITRTMTPGKRALLMAYLEQEQAKEKVASA